ncbi:hypothetical protein DM474_00315 [Lactobacillus helveticus]|uniref:hypothetical protein n=1 Tax=Lactobacillus helveticus TaxID=1587 RepID=UPI000D7BBDB4|nr:hypothetical protein [Lactobacillus helveticus]PXZ21892.1 hypothetical protein DM474_00315 [Lactobacillus helveticus]
MEDTKTTWKQKADKLSELLKTNPEAGEQVVYRSRQGLNDDPVCVPELVSEKMEANSYPDVVTAPPTDMVSPKYSWYGSTGWFENATQQQGTRIAGLEANIKTVSQSLDDLKKEKQTETATSQKQDEKMDKLIKLIAMTNAQIGTLLGKSTGSTTSTQPSQPTTASVVQPTSPVTQQPTAPVTATEGGKK